MALLLDLLVSGQTRLNDDTYAKNIYADKFIRTGSSDSYVLLGGGGHKLLSDFSMSHSHPYLPLAGGTMNNSSTITLPSSAKIVHQTNTTSNYVTDCIWYLGTSAASEGYDAQIGWHNTGDSSGAITILPYKTTTSPWAGTVGLYITKTQLKFNNKKIWREDNDGSGSGLDADTTDGLHLYTRYLGVNGTDWTFASTANSNSTTHIYAPTAVGTSGQILKSTGGTPTWMNTADLTAGKVTCTASTSDKFRPIVLTNESNQLYYSTKIKGNYSTGKIQISGIEIEDSTGNTPLIRYGSANVDTILWKVYSNDQTYANKGVYGFDMTYFGTGSGNTNRLVLHSDNSNASTKVEAISITQDGVVTFSKTITGSISGNAATSTTADQAKKVYMNNSSSNNAYPVLFTNTASAGTPRYDSVYVDSASGAGYNPSTNAFVASIMTAGTHNSTSTLYLDSGTSTTSIIFRIGGSKEVARFAQPNGYLGVGTTSPGYTISAAGTIHATTGFNANGKAVIDSTGRFLPAGTSYRNAGVYGVYDSYKVGHVWSMGTGYSISADGSSTNNLYGLAYFHTNWSNSADYNKDGKTEVSTYAGGHQIAMVQNGKVNAALGTNIWSRGGFIKNGSNDNYALMGGGGHKNISNVQNTAFYKRVVTVNGSGWDMAGTNSNAAFTIFAPSAGGTSGQLLKSNGNAEPGWMDQADVKSDYFKTFNNSRTYHVNFGKGSTDKAWKKIVTGSSSYTSAPSSNAWQATAIRGVIWLSGNNHGGAEIVSYPFSAYFYYVSATSLVNSANLYLPHAGKTPNVMRIVRVSTNKFELQVRQHTDWTNGWVQWQVWNTGTSCTCHTDLPAGSDATVIKQSSDSAILTEAKTQVSFTRSLTSGTKVGTLTIDGTATDLYCQTNTDTNTDTKVTQTITSSSNTSWRPFIVGMSYNDSEPFAPTTVTDSVYATHKLRMQPSTGNIQTYGYVKLYSASGDSPHLIFQRGTASDGTFDWDQYVTGGYFKMRYNNAGTWTEILSLYPGNNLLEGHKIWTAGNDGSGSGLDADTTDGLHLYTRTLGVNGTNWTFASTANANATTHIYAPTSAGTSGQVLKSTGGTPTWMNQSDITAGKVTCPAATSNNDRPIVGTPGDNTLYHTTLAKVNWSTGRITCGGLNTSSYIALTGTADSTVASINFNRAGYNYLAGPSGSTIAIAPGGLAKGSTAGYHFTSTYFGVGVTKTYDLGTSAKRWRDVYARHYYVGGTADNTTGMLTSDSTDNIYLSVGSKAMLVANSTSNVIRSGLSLAGTLDLGANDCRWKCAWVQSLSIADVSTGAKPYKGYKNTSGNYYGGYGLLTVDASSLVYASNNTLPSCAAYIISPNTTGSNTVTGMYIRAADDYTYDSSTVYYYGLRMSDYTSKGSLIDLTNYYGNSIDVYGPNGWDQDGKADNYHTGSISDVALTVYGGTNLQTLSAAISYGSSSSFDMYVKGYNYLFGLDTATSSYTTTLPTDCSDGVFYIHIKHGTATRTWKVGSSSGHTISCCWPGGSRSCTSFTNSNQSLLFTKRGNVWYVLRFN